MKDFISEHLKPRTFEIMPRDPDATGLNFQSSIYEPIPGGHNVICEVYVTAEAEYIKQCLNAQSALLAAHSNGQPIQRYTPEQAERLALIAPDLLTIAHDLHALLWHYDLERRPNGVNWAAPEVLRQEYIKRLEAIFKRMEVKK